MKKSISNWSTYALFFVFLFIFNFVHAEKKAPGLEHFHVCTIASHSHGGLDKLTLSCKLRGIDLKVIGMGKKWYKNATKFIYLQDYLNTLEDDEIVMFLDAFDVLVVADKEKIYKKFLAMNVPFVMAAEKNCYPDHTQAVKYPPSPTPFRFVNSGTYIGYVRNVKKMINDMAPIDPYECDQNLTTLYFVNAPKDQKPFVLDYKCDLFLPLAWVDPKEVSIDQNDPSVVCHTTHSKPCILHANGYSFTLLNMAYDLFYKKFESLYPAPYK